MGPLGNNGIAAGGLLRRVKCDPTPNGNPTESLANLEQLDLFHFPMRRPIAEVNRKLDPHPIEYKVVALRDCPLPTRLLECDTPEKAADYWRLHVATQPSFNPEVETCVVLHLNTRRRIRGHHVVATGILDTLLVHSREVFRTAIVAASHAILVMHSHPSGDPSPSEADIRITRDLIRAGQLLRIEVLDHVIVAGNRHQSLRSMGYFHA